MSDRGRASEPARTGAGPAAGLLSMLSPEAGLLFLAADPSRDRDLAAAIIGRGISWDRFLELATAEGASTQVHHALRELAVPVPAAVQRTAHVQAVMAEFRLLHVARLLERTVAALQREGIDVVLLKGAALAPFVYRDALRRNMSDLDLLVPAGDAQRAQQIAERIGWRGGTSPLPDSFYETHHHLPPMTDGQGIDVWLEIHRDVLPKGHPLGFSGTDLRARSRRVPFAGGSVLVPTAEDLLLFTCVHFAWSHEMRVGSWKTFCDVVELVSHADFSWARFLERAAERSVATSAYWTLRLASRLCGVSVPGEVLGRLRPALPDRLLEMVERHFVLQLYPATPLSPSVWLARALWSVGMRPRRSGHRRARPWRVTPGWLVEGGEGAGRGPARWRYRLSGPVRTAIYLRRVASGPASP
ncbi:MAG TPA: nucleotidyltransferase family protein [Gemmatimonadaceae bacterium]|nr:nucleotidyltransferase family protein [Gemmatimonadaceae bacterium]